jgi:pimeloyl-ACP methyl ester carboxylesterase
VLCLLSLFAGLILTPASAHAAGTVSCATFTAALRDSSQTSPFLTLMKNSSSTFTNPANGQTFRYLAVLPANPGPTQTYETLVFFNGTSQITPDWPVGMLTTSTTALCDGNALVFADYPGIGETSQPADAEFTFDNISSDVFSLLVYLNDFRGFKIRSVNPTGWSLGTESALKFSALASANGAFLGRGMRINKVFLVAGKAGGDLDSSGAATPQSCSSTATPPLVASYYSAIGNPSMCVVSMFDRLFDLDTFLEWTAATSLKTTLVGMLFPYSQPPAGSLQNPYGANDPSTICATTLSTDNKVASLCNLQSGQSITSACDAGDANCLATKSLFEKNRLSRPYLDDISHAQYAAQRRLSFTYGYGACTGSAGSSWTSLGCTFNPSQTSSKYYKAALVVNGGPCRVIETGSDSSSPFVVDCPQFASRLGGVYVFNGEEDLFIRHDYGNALCNWFNSSGTAPCTVTTFPNAGHGVQYVYPGQIYSAIRGALPSPR